MTERFTIKEIDNFSYGIKVTDVIMDNHIELPQSTVCDLLNNLSDENEQLKQYIYDNLDEDICDVCSYQYLEKSQRDKYYVAKCKKGYDNCSKGTVIHCKDFKFKELEE